MEKYGVETQPENPKMASENTEPQCPSCGSKLTTSANVPVCPRCGTKPFEPKG